MLILSRKFVTNEVAAYAAFKAATSKMYVEDVLDQTLGDIAATSGAVVLVARPSTVLPPRVELALDRATACLASAFLAHVHSERM